MNNFLDVGHWMRFAFTAFRQFLFSYNLHKYSKVYWLRLDKYLYSWNNVPFFTFSVVSVIFSETFGEIMQQPRYSPAPQNAMRPQTRPPVPNVSEFLKVFRKLIWKNAFLMIHHQNLWNKKELCKVLVWHNLLSLFTFYY